MKTVKAIPNLLAATAVLIFGPFIGVLIGLILALLALTPNSTFIRNSGHVVSGEGILILLYVAISLVISVPMSIFGAGLLLFGSRSEELQEVRADGA